jgi:glycosyltransferase involved in cell wall biosynthesis
MKGMSIMEGKPLVSFILLAHNQEGFIREAIKGALSQTYSPLEIIFSDDCSTDNSYEIMKKAAAEYSGKHKIILNRNAENEGTGGHINRAMEKANGELIVVAAGDDISMPDRVVGIYKAYEASHRKAKSIYSNTIEIDEVGRVLDVPAFKLDNNRTFNSNDLINEDAILTGSSHAWSREVFDVFGPLLPPVVCEDIVIPFRSSLLGEIVFVDEPLVKHRRHPGNIWNYYRGSNVDRDIAHGRFWTYEKVNIFKNWIADINRMKVVQPSNMKDWEYLESVAVKRLDLAEMETTLYSGTLIDRIVTIVRIAVRERSIRALRHRIGLFVLPRVYRKHMTRKTKRRSARSVTHENAEAN